MRPTAPHVAHRLAVGDDEQRPAEAQVHELLEPLLGPHRVALHAQRGLLLGGQPRPRQALGHPGHLLGERGEERVVGQRRRRRELPGAQRARPLRHALHRVGYRPADHEERDDRHHHREHSEAQRVGPPERPLRGVEVRGVQEHRERADALVVARERRRVDVGALPVDLGEPPHRQARGHRLGDLGHRARGRAGAGPRADERGGDAVVDRDRLPGALELGHDALEPRRRRPLHDRLHRLLEALGEQERAALEVGGEPVPLGADLQHRERGDHREGRQGQRRGEAVGNSHPVTCVGMRGKLQNLSVGNENSRLTVESSVRRRRRQPPNT